MMKKYIVEKGSWIIFFCFIQLFILFISYIDPMLEIHSIIYIILLSTVIFLIFFITQYYRDTGFYKSVRDYHPTVEIEKLKRATSPFEKIVEEALQQQNEHYKREMNQIRINTEEEKDDIVSWIHEVKTPLTTMKLMLDRIDNNTLRGQMMNEWLRIHLLLDQQLHQRRLPFMEKDLYLEMVLLEEVVYTEIKELRSFCLHKGIGFDVSLEETKVLSDAKWLKFILRQLFTNAIKYSENSDIEITSKNVHGHINLTIQDYGRGIDAKDLPRIFDKGFTSTTNHKDNAATGMGLYLTKKVADNLKIQIYVQSALGEGTTFSLTFPKKNDFIAITSM